MENLSTPMPVHKPKITMKVKILSVTFILIAGALGFYMKFANDLFVRDKESYVFDSALSRAGSIASQLYSSINVTNNSLLSIAILQKENNLWAQKLIDQDDSILFYSNLTIEDGKWKSKSTLINKKLLRDLTDQELILEQESSNKTEEKILELLPKNTKIERAAFPVKLNKTNFLGLIIKDPRSSEYFYGVVHLPMVHDQVNQDPLYKNVILDMNREVLFGNKKDYDKAFVKSLDENKLTQGTRKVNLSGEEKLASYVKENSLGIMTLSIADSKQVFSIIDLVVKKGLYFGLFILGVALSMGVILSVTLTSPIRKLLSHVSEVGQGNFESSVKITTRDEFFNLGESFNWMTNNIGTLIKELDDLNKNLEKKVEERTRELKEAYSFLDTMVNSLDQGLVVIDKDQKCLSVHTKAAEDILGQNPEGKNYFELIGKNETEDQKAINKRWIDATFSEALPFNSVKTLGPQFIQDGTDFHDSSFRYIDLNYFPMKNDEDKLAYVVAVATDQTETIKSQKSFEEKKAKVDQIIKIIENTTSYFSFLNEARMGDGRWEMKDGRWEVAVSQRLTL